MKTRSDALPRLPNFLEPMQAKLVDATRPGAWIYEIKFDGYRALALRGGNRTRILSRNQKDVGKKFPTIAESINELGVQDAIIDYAASGIINTMPYPVLRRTEHGVSSCEALSGAA
jgi:ATP-dependent DNA ligase